MTLGLDQGIHLPRAAKVLIMVCVL